MTKQDKLYLILAFNEIKINSGFTINEMLTLYSQSKFKEFRHVASNFIQFCTDTITNQDGFIAAGSKREMTASVLERLTNASPSKIASIRMQEDKWDELIQEVKFENTWSDQKWDIVVQFLTFIVQLGRIIREAIPPKMTFNHGRIIANSGEIFNDATRQIIIYTILRRIDNKTGDFIGIASIRDWFSKDFPICIKSILYMKNYKRFKPLKREMVMALLNHSVKSSMVIKIANDFFSGIKSSYVYQMRDKMQKEKYTIPFIVMPNQDFTEARKQTQDYFKAIIARRRLVQNARWKTNNVEKNLINWYNEKGGE